VVCGAVCVCVCEWCVVRCAALWLCWLEGVCYDIGGVGVVVLCCVAFCCVVLRCAVGCSVVWWSVVCYGEVVSCYVVGCGEVRR